MSLNRLKTLVAIAESGSFVEAAQRVFLTPAAVGQQIKLLEKEFGVQLFDRNMRSPRLNPLGRALVPRAREIIKSYEDLVPSLLGEQTEIQKISIGAVPTTMAGLVPRALSALRSSYRNLHIRVMPGLSADLLPLVEQGYLDAAIISKSPQTYAHMLFRAFAEEPYVLLAPADADAVEPEQLLESQPFIRFNRRAFVGQQVDDWLRRKKIKVIESMELDTLEMISSMVFHGLGVSIVPRPCVPSPRPLPIQQIPLDASASSRTLGIISHPDSTKFKLIDILLGELTRIVSLCEEVESQRYQSNN